jgi:hypothetical protein
MTFGIRRHTVPDQGKLHRVPCCTLTVAISLAGIVTARGPQPRQQPSIAVVTVIDSLARYPLVNADVIDLNTGQHRLTDEHGEARLAWPNDGQLRLRIRQVGYEPRQRTLRLPDSSKAATTFAMNKIAYVISPVRSTSHCATASDSASLDLSLSELDQLKQAAEKYDQFRRLFPFEATIERRTAAVPRSGKVRRITAAKETFRSENWQEEYKPGDIIEYERGAFTVPILFLSTLGDSVFWEHHCFIARGVESYQGTRVVRLEFSPSTDVTGPDYAGAALLDSTTSHLLRVDFHLANLRQRNGPKRLEGYITFMSPTPYVMMPDTTVAIWWMRNVSDTTWGNPDFGQSLNLQELRYRRSSPPAHENAKQ